MYDALCNHGILGTYYALALLRFGGIVKRGIENGDILIVTLSSIRAVNQVLSLAKTLPIRYRSVAWKMLVLPPYLPTLPLHKYSHLGTSIVSLFQASTNFYPRIWNSLLSTSSLALAVSGGFTRYQQTICLVLLLFHGGA